MSRFHAVAIAPRIVRRLMRGDRKAQEVVYRAYANAVYTLAARILRDEAQAEEVAQDTFVDVIRRASDLDDVDALPAWIRAIAVNHCLMRLRSPWHRRRESLDADEQVVDDRSARAVDIDQALGRLSPDARMVVWMHCIEGYTHEEIGRAFGRTTSFSKSCLARAYRSLAKARGTLESRAPVVEDRGNAATPGRIAMADGRTVRTDERTIPAACAP